MAIGRGVEPIIRGYTPPQQGMARLILDTGKLPRLDASDDRLVATESGRLTILAPITIVVPTFRERENLPELIERIDAVRREHGLTLELIVMDDRSNDGSREWVAGCGCDWVRLIERDGPRGLSPAVLEGIEVATHPVVVVMDADLSHPPERIPAMILALHAGQELVIGSRYVSGGSTDSGWGFLRWLNSFIATKLAYPLTSVRDPMAGFFALRRRELRRADYLNPIGYKIGLELIVKCRLTNVGEVPIRFTDRVHGESKLTFKEQLRYLQHLRRLYLYKFGTWSHLAQFLVVGASGVVVNLLVLYGLLAIALPVSIAVAGGIGVSLVTNFALNRRFSFSYARERSVVKQFVGFAGACSVGAAVNYGVTLASLSLWSTLPIGVAAMVGIAAGMGFNFLISRYLVFRSGTGRVPMSP
ncbi:MAG: glycosyltransferase [Phycisphaeraceae bacterium]